jgi:hypothetical protein
MLRRADVVTILQKNHQKLESPEVVYSRERAADGLEQA